MGGLGILLGELITIRNHVILSYPYKLMSGYLYFSNNLKDRKKPYIGWYDKLENLFPINGNSFQGKTKLIAIPYILQ